MTARHLDQAGRDEKIVCRIATMVLVFWIPGIGCGAAWAVAGGVLLLHAAIAGLVASVLAFGGALITMMTLIIGPERCAQQARGTR